MTIRRQLIVVFSAILSCIPAHAKNQDNEKRAEFERSKPEGAFSDGSTVELNVGALPVVQIKDKTTGSTCYIVYGDNSVSNMQCLNSNK